MFVSIFNRRRSISVLYLGLISLSLYALGCSRAALQPTPPPPPLEEDHLIDIKGRVCGEPPEEEAFPIKILFVIDQSTYILTLLLENILATLFDIGRLTWLIAADNSLYYRYQV